jgi:hypothetical protein
MARYRAVTGSCWNVPALSNGRIYVRSATNAACLDVSIPRLRLTAESPSSNAFRIFLGSADGAPLASNRATNITISAATNVDGIWTLLTNPLIFTNGQFRFDDPDARTRPRRFYRAEDRP